MKKLSCLLMVLVFTVIFASMCFAAPDDVSAAVYDEDTTIITDEDTPGSAADSSTIEINDGVVPADAPVDEKLAQTGGIPAEAFYAIGAIFIVSALIISRKKKSSATK